MHSMVLARRMSGSALALVLAAAMALGSGEADASADSESRIALVVGNGNYDPSVVSRLENPVNDAQLMARTLEYVGFDVSLLTDGKRNTIERAVAEFGTRLKEAGRDAVGLFYYAGHGVERSGQNYLIPLGASIESPLHLAREAVPAQYVLDWMEHAGNRLNIVILDACRNNPYERTRSVPGASTRGLAPMKGPSGTLIAYSAGPGEAAADGIGNSPYTQALAEEIVEPGLQLEEVFKRVRVRVERATGNVQTPWENSSLVGYFYFVPAGEENLRPLPPVETPAQAYALAEGIHTIAAFQAVVDHYGGTIYATLAQERIRLLQRETSPEAVEASLALERDERRLIEAGLVSLGFEPGPVDGLFGVEARTALRSWQSSKGEDATGFLSERAASELKALGEQEEGRLVSSEAPGVYLSAAVAAGQLVSSGHLRTVQPGEIPVQEIQGYSAIATGCYEQALPAGRRLAWSDIGIYCAP